MTGIWIALGALLSAAVGFVFFKQQLLARVNERMTFVQRREGRLLEVTTAISEELQLRPLLLKIIEAVCEILNADRATLFLFDEASDELWSDVCLLYTSPSPRDRTRSRMPSSA